MKVIEKKQDDGTVKFECEATAQEVNNALRYAGESFAASMGIRPQKDKTVQQACKEQLGIADLDKVIEPQAIEALVPHALDKRNMVPAIPPKAQPTSVFQRGKRFSFTMNVMPKPTYELTSYEPVEVSVPRFVFDESQVDNQLEELAKNATTYEKADPKPLESGDACSIAMKCFDEGEEMKGLTCEDRTYVTGQGFMPEGFDEAIIGMEPGDTKEFTFDAPMDVVDDKPVMRPIQCTVAINCIQRETTPAIDDAWVRQNMPMYPSLDALRADMRRAFEAQQREQYTGYVQQAAVSQLSKRFEGRIADELYEATRDQLVSNLRQDLQQQGMKWEDFIEQNGGEQQFGMMLMLQTRETLVQGFCLDAVYRHEKLKVADKDLNAACRSMNSQANPAVLRQQLEEAGRGFALRETAERMKAAQFVTEHAKITYQGDAADASAAAQADGAAAQTDE